MAKEEIEKKAKEVLSLLKGISIVDAKNILHETRRMIEKETTVK